MNDFVVYVHTNKTDGKRYVGITSQGVGRRWRPDGSGYKENPHFWNAIQKYGWDGFSHDIVASGISRSDACRMEKELIAEYKCCDQRFGYNVSPGGEHNTMSEEGRRRLSESRKGKNTGKDNPNYGNHKLAGKNNPNYGKKHSEEMRKLMSERRKGNGLHKFSDEHRRKISENHGGGAKKKMVFCVETETIYESINDAARAVGINKKLISNCCRGVKHYNTAKGYHWRFCEE